MGRYSALNWGLRCFICHRSAERNKGVSAPATRIVFVLADIIASGKGKDKLEYRVLGCSTPRASNGPAIQTSRLVTDFYYFPTVLCYQRSQTFCVLSMFLLKAPIYFKVELSGQKGWKKSDSGFFIYFYVPVQGPKGKHLSFPLVMPPPLAIIGSNIRKLAVSLARLLRWFFHLFVCCWNNTS